MKTAISMILVSIGLLSQPAFGGTVLGVDGKKCYPATFTPTLSTVTVYGDFIENIGRVTAPAGVTATILKKLNGLQNSSGSHAGKGAVVLNIKTVNAGAGVKTISLINDLGGDTFTFTISVIPLPTVSTVDIPVPADPFDQITVTLHGTGLNAASDPAKGAIVQDNLVPFVTVGGSAAVSSVRVLSTTATALQVKIFFTALVQDVSVDLGFNSSSDCVPLGILPVSVDAGMVPDNAASFKKRVRLKSGSIRNFVTSVDFPQGNTFDLHSVGTINLHLLFTAPASLGNTTVRLQNGTQIVLAGGSNGSGDNATVFVKFRPANAFTQDDGTPFTTISGGFIVFKANPGDNIIPVRFKVVDCLGATTNIQSNGVFIDTWMHSTNATVPPDFVEQPFSVHCTSGGQ